MQAEGSGRRAIFSLGLLATCLLGSARFSFGTGADVITADITGTINWGTLLTCGDTSAECATDADCNACTGTGLPCLSDDDCRTCSLSGAPCLVSDDCPDPLSESCDIVETCDLSGNLCDTMANSFSIGSVSCNVGDVPLLWCDNNSQFCDDEQHPVIAQNMYRYAQGRFEHIGMSWVKHGFAAVDGPGCGVTCESRCTIGGQLCGSSADCGPGEGTCGTNDLLGVGCWDIYGAQLNGSQFYLGPKSEVNAFTGTFPFPPTFSWREEGDTGFKRLIVRNDDLDPALNPGAVYLAEAHYVAADDAEAGNAVNNVSYHLLQMVQSQDQYLGLLTDGETTQSEQPAIQAWKLFQPTVIETMVDIPNEGRFILAGDATAMGDGFWHYEYALYNLNSDRSVGSFSIPLPLGGIVLNPGFHDVSYHSGEAISGTEWTPEITNSAITWTTESFAANPNANALRWGTLYNFRFEANVPPDLVTGQAAIGLFKPGNPAGVVASIVAPALDVIDCNNNGVPDETDIANGTSDDCDTNGVPDDCQADCNTNGVADTCDLRDETSPDCNLNEVPDECDVDCDGNGQPDNCDIDMNSGAPGGPFFCVAMCDPDCNDNGVPDACDPDCNENGIADGCNGDPLLPDTDGDGVNDCEDNCRLTSPPESCTCPELVCCDVADFPPCAFMLDWEVCIDVFDGIPACIPSDLCRDGCLLGDLDNNGVLNLRDVAGLMTCYSGPTGTPGYVLPSAQCLTVYDFELDDDIDPTDYALWHDAAFAP